MATKWTYGVSAGVLRRHDPRGHTEQLYAVIHAGSAATLVWATNFDHAYDVWCAEMFTKRRIALVPPARREVAVRYAREYEQAEALKRSRRGAEAAPPTLFDGQRPTDPLTDTIRPNGTNARTTARGSQSVPPAPNDSLATTPADPALTYALAHPEQAQAILGEPSPPQERSERPSRPETLGSTPRTPDTSRTRQGRTGTAQATPDASHAPTLDARASSRAANDGIARADAHANLPWRDAADAAVELVAAAHDTFTVDEVRAALLDHFPHFQTHNMSALGAVMRRAAKNGLIANTGEFRRSEMVQSHRDLRPVWRSLIRPSTA